MPHKHFFRDDNIPSVQFGAIRRLKKDIFGLYLEGCGIPEAFGVWVWVIDDFILTGNQKKGKPQQEKQNPPSRLQ